MKKKKNLLIVSVLTVPAEPVVGQGEVVILQQETLLQDTASHLGEGVVWRDLMAAWLVASG